jgi:hypothetical protein
MYGLTSYGTHPDFQIIKLLHEQIHLLAAEMQELHSTGRNPEALAKMGELHRQRDRLLNQLKLLAHVIGYSTDSNYIAH